MSALIEKELGVWRQNREVFVKQMTECTLFKISVWIWTYGLEIWLGEAETWAALSNYLRGIIPVTDKWNEMSGVEGS